MVAYNPFELAGNSFDLEEASIDHTDEFDKLVKELKRAYCDAYMTSLNYVVAGDEYVEYPRNTHGFATEQRTITRPTDDGEGGGTCTSAQTVGKTSFVATFNDLRSQIDATVSNFRYFATGKEMQQACDHSNLWASSLHPYKQENDSSIPYWLELIGHDLDKETSLTLDRVAAEMVGKIQPALSYLQDATYALTSLYVTTRHALLITRSDVRKALRTAISACNTYTASRGIVPILKISSTILKITDKAQNLMKGDLNTIADSIDRIADWLTVDEDEEWLNFPLIITPTNIIDALKKSLDKINTNLTSAEKGIKDGFGNIANKLSECNDEGTIRIDKQSASSDKYSSNIEISWTDLKNTYDHNLPRVAELLRKVKNEAHNTRYPSAFSHSSAIGLGTSGAWPTLVNTLNSIQDCIERLAESCEGIAAGLRDYEADTKATETESYENLSKIRRTLDRYITVKPRFS